MSSRLLVYPVYKNGPHVMQINILHLDLYPLRSPKMMLTFVVLSTLVGLSLQQCNPSTCMLPNCRCYADSSTPGGFMRTDTPQIVFVSFEGTINSENIKFYRPLFSNIVNPNNCPVRGTFFIEDMGSDYSLIKGLYDEGHEIGVHSVDGVVPKGSSAWIAAIKKVTSELSKFGVDMKNVKGVRAPELSIGGDDELIGFGSDMLYDSSCINVARSTASTFLWPYTFDFMQTGNCDIGTAPTKPFPGKWEVPLADLHDLDGDKLPCQVPSACRNITTKRNAFDLFFTAFADHYNGARTPFLLIIDPAWAKDQEKMDGTAQFLQYIRAAFGKDVWIVPVYKGLQWVQTPVPISNLTDFKPWQC